MKLLDYIGLSQWLHYKMIVFVNVIFDVFICQKQTPSLPFIHSS